ncbi:hypothetical protein CRG98_029467 [Punica granatum]|uniref:Uncharacterized protein n=1 Tax=Punica granatum TaxID=22663 RepID=A0A2I0J265_PUNGR|nr:hypothetical protein CRG98_029467 [Punica granatum]
MVALILATAALFEVVGNLVWAMVVEIGTTTTLNCPSFSLFEIVEERDGDLGRWWPGPPPK